MSRLNKRKSPDGPAKLGPFPARAVLAQAATALLLGAVVLALAFGTPALQARVSRTLAAGAPRVEFDWPMIPGDGPDQPARTWLSPDMQAGLVHLAQQTLAADPDALSTTALSRVGRALLDTGWFATIETVCREPGNGVRVRGTWRTPAAVVRHGGLDHLVARGGELLPPTYLPGQSGQRVILGASTPPPMRDGKPVCGEVWGASRTGGHKGMSDVQAGVELVDLIRTRPWRAQVAAVDVSAYARQRRLDLVTTSNGRVIWGGAPGEKVYGETSLKTKLWRIMEINRRTGTIDAGRPSMDISGTIAMMDDTPLAPPPAPGRP